MPNFSVAKAITGKFLTSHDLPEVWKLWFYLPEDDQEQVMAKGGGANEELCLQFRESKGGNPLTRMTYNLILELDRNGSFIPSSVCYDSPPIRTPWLILPLLILMIIHYQKSIKRIQVYVFYIDRTYTHYIDSM